MVDSDKNPVVEVSEIGCGKVEIGDIIVSNNVIWLFRNNEIINSKDLGKTWKKIRVTTPWDAAQRVNVVKKGNEIFILTDEGFWKYAGNL
jgi:hypothetical protein